MSRREFRFGICGAALMGVLLSAANGQPPAAAVFLLATAMSAWALARKA